VERLKFTTGIFDFLKELQRLGFLLVIVTNQAGVGRGKFSEDQYYSLREHIHDKIKKSGVSIDLELACFAHPDAVVAGYKSEDHSWRKPNPGMIEYAVEVLNIDLSRSFIMGDRCKDMLAGMRGGVGKCIWFCSGFYERTQGVLNYDEATDIISKKTEMTGKVKAVKSFQEALDFIKSTII